MANSRVANTWKPKGMTVDLKNDKMTKENFADYIITMKEPDINYNFIMKAFGSFDGKVLANPYDLLIVPVGKFTYTDKEEKQHSNSNEFTTTVGLYIFNLILSGIGFSWLFDGYINQNINKKIFKGIEKKLSYALIEDDIDVDQIKRWENTCQWMMPFEDILSPNHTEKFITCTKAINKKKQELLKKYAKEIEEGDLVVIENIEKELIAYAKEYLGDDPSLDLLDSSAGASWGNTFKNMYLMRGAVANPDINTNKKYNIITSSYIDGVSAEEYTTMAGSGTHGAYSRGKKTEIGGYWEKLFVSAYQHITLDPKGSDCHTDKFIEVELTDKNAPDYMYSYIINNNGTLTLMDSKNYKNYIGKKVKFRFSSMCKSKTGICNMCAGELLYKVVANVGTVMSQIPDVLKNKSMSAFHNNQTVTTKMDPMDAFFPFKS